MLKAGTDGAFAAVIHAVSDSSGQPIDSMYFWATGILSSFLDNAPTYLRVLQHRRRRPGHPDDA